MALRYNYFFYKQVSSIPGNNAGESIKLNANIAYFTGVFIFLHMKVTSVI